MMVAVPARLPSAAAAVSANPSSEVATPVTTTTPADSLCNSTTVPNGTQELASLCVGGSPQSVVFDPANGLLYAASENSQNVSVVNASTLEGVQAISVSNARGMALDPTNGYLFVTNGEGSTVTVINTTNGAAVLTTFNLAGYTDLVGAQYDSLNGLVYFLANNSAALVGVNPTTDAISQVISVDPNSGGEYGYAIDPSNGLIYFPSLDSDSVQVINQSTGATETYVSMAGAGSPYGPTSTFLDPQNGLIYAILGGTPTSPGNLAYAFDTHTGNTVARLSVGSLPNAYAYDPTHHLLYISCAASGSISVINATSDELVDTIALGAGTLPSGIAVDPATGDVYVAEDGTGLLVELPSASTSLGNAVCQPVMPPVETEILSSVCTGGESLAMAYDPTNHLVYESLETTQNVSVLDPNGPQVVTSIPTHNYARGLAFDPYNQLLYVSGDFGDNVAIVNTTSNSLVGSFNLTGYTNLVGAQYDTTTRQLFFLANNNDDILVVNTTTDSVVEAIGVPEYTGGGSGPIAGVDPQTHVMYYASLGGDDIEEIGELNGTAFGYLPSGSSYAPTNTFFDTYNQLLYVEDGGQGGPESGNQVAILNVTTGHVVSTLTVGEFPHRFGYDPVRHLLYISCSVSGTVSVINDTTNRVVGTISLGPTTEPGAIFVDPVTGNVYVGESGTGMVVELPPGAPAANTSGYWSPQSVPSSPSGRAGFGVVYDTAMGKVVVFGGCTSGAFTGLDCNATNELWAFSGDVWTQLHSGISPSARVLPQMAYDPTTGSIVMFGGLSGYPNNTALNDTWEFNGTSWSELSPTTSPPASGMDESMAYDPAAGAIVLFASGERAGAGGTETAYLNETWELSGGQWTEVENGTGPSPRGGEALDFDPATSSLLLFGGSACSGPADSEGCPNLGGTWTFANGSWTPKTPSVSPSPRALAAMAYDPLLKAALLFGGQSADAALDDMWVYANGSWTPFVSSPAPSPREAAGLVFDAADHTMVLFGGYFQVGSGSEGADLYYNDTWTFEVGTPPASLSVVSMEASTGPTPVGRIALVVGDVVSATAVSYSFSGLPPGCIGFNSSLLICTPTAAGVFKLTLTVVNGYGASSSGSIVLYVGVTPPSPPSSRSPAGEPSLLIVVSGGTGVLVGVAAVAGVAYARERKRRRERREGDAIARELEKPSPPDGPTP